MKKLNQYFSLDDYFNREFVTCVVVASVLIYVFLFWGTLRGETVTIEIADSTLDYVNHVRVTAVWFDFFKNNFRISVFTMIPFVGSWMLFVQYNTGYVMGSLAKAVQMDGMLYLAGVMTNWTGILEYIANALAYGESLYLVYSLVERKFFTNLRNHSARTLYFVGVLLAVAAIIEIRYIYGLM